jgi:hypothetical protein
LSLVVSSKKELSLRVEFGVQGSEVAH